MKVSTFLHLIQFVSMQSSIISSFMLSYTKQQQQGQQITSHKYNNNNKYVLSPHQPFLLTSSPTKIRAYASKDSSLTDSTTIVSPDEIMEYAKNEQVILSFTTLGPGFRAIARPAHNTTQILGYCSGFIRPSGKILHLDEMQVFKKALTIAREENPEFRGGGTVFGVGLLLGSLCFRHGIDNGCEIGEFLAIDDGESQHTRLVRHYKRLGLSYVRYVGEDILNVPDRLIWGGCGTLMNANLVKLLGRWSYIFSRTHEK